MIMHHASCIWKCKSTTTCRFRQFEIGIVIAAESCISRYVRECSNPNITGEIHGIAHGKDEQATASGAFTRSLVSATGNATGSGWTERFVFSANKSNSMYKGTNIQPSALQALIIIRVWRALGCTVFDEYKELESEARNLRFDNAQALLLPSPPAPFFAWVCPKAPWIRKSFSVVVDCMFWSMPPVMFG